MIANASSKGMVQLIALTRDWASTVPYTAKPLGREWIHRGNGCLTDYKGFIDGHLYYSLQDSENPRGKGAGALLYGVFF